MSLLFATTAMILIIMTLIPLSSRRDWWIRAMDFPSQQIIIVSLLWLIFWLFQTSTQSLLSIVLAAAIFTVLIRHCRLLYPYTEMCRQEVETYDAHWDGERPTLSLLYSNVSMSSRNSTALLALIKKHQPDVFVTLETNDWWQQQLDGIEKYSHTIACPLENLHGMHVYSQLPLHDSQILHRVDDDKPSISTQIEIHEGTRVSLHITHPASPASIQLPVDKTRETELMQLATDLAKDHKKTIVIGNFKDVAWSSASQLFKHTSGLLDPRIGRGVINTFNAFHWFARWPLDHIYLSDHFKVVSLERLQKIGSDHFPILLKLAVVDNSTAMNRSAEVHKSVAQTSTEN